MTLRRLAPLVSAIALAGVAIPTAGAAARPDAACTGCQPAVSAGAKAQPLAFSVELLRVPAADR